MSDDIPADKPAQAPPPAPDPHPGNDRTGPDVVPAVVPVASAVTKDGHLLLVRMPAGSAVVCSWLTEGTQTDVTAWFADLVLIGWSDTVEQAATARPDPVEQVEVARLRMEPPQAADAVTVTYVHLPTREAVEVPWAQALTFAGRGINVQVTAGVAADAADREMPDTVPAD